MAVAGLGQHALGGGGGGGMASMAEHMLKPNACDGMRPMEEERGGMRLPVRWPSHYPPGWMFSMLGSGAFSALCMHDSSPSIGRTRHLPSVGSDA